MSISPSIAKCLSKITQIESTQDISSLEKNYRNYHSLLRKQKKNPLLQNPYSKDNFNTYNTYLRLKRKVTNYYKTQEAIKTSHKCITSFKKRKRLRQSPTKATPDYTINRLNDKSNNHNQCNNNDDCNCLGKDLFLPKQLFTKSSSYYRSSRNGNNSHNANNIIIDDSNNNTHTIIDNNTDGDQNDNEDEVIVPVDESIHCENGDQNYNEDEVIVPVDESIHCANCFRRNSQYLIDKYQNNDTYTIEFYEHSSIEIKRRKKFRSVQATNGNSLIQQYILCGECSNYLVRKNDTNEAKQHKYMWPAFIWFFLTNKNVLCNYGSQIWSFIPSQWRYWWIQSLKEEVSIVFDNVTISSPKPNFVDKSIEIQEWNDNISSLLLSRLASSCNKHILPQILCPWGCTEFNHRCDNIQMDLIYQRYLPKAKIELMSGSVSFYATISARDDYIRFDGNYDKWLLNPNWEVLPSISFVNGKGPMVLTCRDHKNGTKNHMIHPPRQPLHILPSDYSDQLCHAVIKPRTIRPLKSCKYSNSYQMHEQRGTFNGIDTCSVSNYGRFDFCSKLLSDNESRSIKNRPDINSLLTQLNRNKKISNKVVASMREDAELNTQHIDFDEYIDGSNYIPVMAAATLQRELKVKLTKMIWDCQGSDQNGNQLPSLTYTCKKIWPSVLYPVQKNDTYGAYFPAVPYCNATNSNTSMIWMVSSLLTRLECLWQSVIEMNGGFYQSKWHGWMLTYLTKRCFFNSNNCKTQKTDPFKFSCINSHMRLFEKIGAQLTKDTEIAIIFEGIPNVLSVSSFDDVEEALSVDDHNIIIIENWKPGESIDVIDNNSLPNRQVYEDVEYELRVCIEVTNMDTEDNSWESKIFNRHGNNHSSWWCQSSKKDALCIQVEELPDFLVDEDQKVVVVYVKIEKIDFNTLNHEYLQYIGGQQHIFCNEHKMPLIISADRKMKCNCGSNEHFSCPHLDCKCCICKQCANQKDKASIHTITMNDDDRTILSEVEDEESKEEEEQIEPHYDDDQESAEGNDNNGNIDLNELDDEEINQILNLRFNNDDILEKDDLNEFLATSTDPDTDPPVDDEEEYQMYPPIPTTNAGEIPFEIEQENERSKDKITVSGHVMLNQNGTVLTRKKHQINGSSLHKFFLQKICATTVGSSIPILYPESMLFPSIFYHMAADGAISGAIPAPLLTENIKQYGFEPLPKHIRSRLTACSSATGTDPRYIAFSYDTMINLSVNHEDTRMVLNRGVTIDKESESSLGVRGKKYGESSILESIDSKQMVKNLSSAEKYINKFDYFITLTCNMKKHFGTKIVKNWIDSDEWNKHYNGYDLLSEEEKKEIEKSISQAAAVIFLRIWEEISILFLDYLKHSKSSPYKDVFAIFARKEYQKERGNVSHTHLMLKVNWDNLSDEEKKFMDDLIRASVVDVVRTDEVNHLIEHGLLESMDDLKEVLDDAEKVLGHRCGPACLVRDGPNSLKCKKLNNLIVSPDNTKHIFKDLPNQYSLECLERLVQIGLVENIIVSKDGYEAPFKSNLEFFHPKRHIPPTNPTGDINMSPVEGYFFTACRSMQNVQYLTLCGGVNKYVVKYIGKIDEQNYVIICTDSSKNGKLVSKSFFLHNTKVVGSKINEDKRKEQNREKNHAQGRAISQNEMVHVMLQYAEVYTDLNFVAIPTIPLELRAGVDKSQYYCIEDSADAGIISDIVRKDIVNDEWRHHTEPEKLILEDLKLSKVTVDKVTQFSVRPPELRFIIDQIGNYFRWFKVVPKLLNEETMRKIIDSDIRLTSWVDGLQRIVKIRREAIPELYEYINNQMRHHDKASPHIECMINLFNEIHSHYEDRNVTAVVDEAFGIHLEKDLIYYDPNLDHLPIPVYSYIKPTMGTQFILHLLLSMGHFSTEIDLTLHPSLRESFRSSHLIGPLNDVESLQQYSNELLKKFIVDQLQYFPNSKRVIDSWIITAGELLDDIIVHDNIPINNMPAVQQSSLYASTEEKCIQYINTIKENVIKSALSELRDESIERCSIPSYESILSATKANRIDWDAIDCFSQNESQPDSSFKEQSFAIQKCVQAINLYRDGMSHNSFIKSIGIRGFAGCGKSWTMQYIMLYAMSQGLLCIPTAMMSRRSVFLGGKHIHILFCIPADRNVSPHRLAEIAITKLLRDPKKMNLVRSLDCLFLDEIGQLSSEMLAVIDIILRRVKDTNIFMGGVLIISTIDHTQLQPVQGRPFLTSSHVITCFQMTMLCTSVRASNDPNFQRIQEIARMHYKVYQQQPELLDEFKLLLSNTCTFVSDWSDPEITPSTYRLYSKKFPAKEATRQFISAVTQSIESNHIIEKNADDVQKSRYSHGEWMTASDEVKASLDQRLKEPRTLLFFRGALYEFTYNNEEKYSQGQMAILFDLPSQDMIDRNKKIKVLAVPPGLQDVGDFNHDIPKEFYLNQGFKEVTIGIAPERIHSIGRNLQAQRKQYGLKHRVTSTIHAAMGDTLSRVAIEISRNDSSFRLWDCAQAIVTLSRTKLGKNLIFVGSKNETINALVELIQMKSQWTDYMEEVLSLITIRNENINDNEAENPRHRQLTQSHYPFRICDVVLPQCNTGFVYMLLSIVRPTYSYIGETKCIRSRLEQHNSGHGSSSTEPAYLRPFGVLAFICGFNGEKPLRRYVEKKWKERRDDLIRDGINDYRQWARVGNEVIENLNQQELNTEKSELRLILMFR